MLPVSWVSSTMTFITSVFLLVITIFSSENIKIRSYLWVVCYMILDVHQESYSFSI